MIERKNIGEKRKRRACIGTDTQTVVSVPLEVGGIAVCKDSMEKDWQKVGDLSPTGIGPAVCALAVSCIARFGYGAHHQRRRVQ